MSRRLLILLALLLAAIMVSGCCCCCCGGRRFYSPDAYPSTYRVTVVPAPDVRTPHTAVNPAMKPATDIAPGLVSPGR